MLLMKKQSPFLWLAAGLLLSAMVVYDTATWIAVSTDPVNSFQQAQTQYLNKYSIPSGNARLLTLIFILIGSLATFCLVKSHYSSSKSLRISIKILISLNLLLILWRVFSLM